MSRATRSRPAHGWGPQFRAITFCETGLGIRIGGGGGPPRRQCKRDANFEFEGCNHVQHRRLRIVETDLLQSVTQRYQPNVMITRLPKIKADRLSDAIAVIMPLFDKACRYIASHSQPLETLSIRPTVDELKQDWTELQAARDTYTKDEISRRRREQS